MCMHLLDPTQFPLLLPQDDEATAYDGYINVHNSEYRIKLKIPFQDVCQTVIEAEWKLQVIIEEYKTLIQQRLKQCNSLGSFLKELITILESQLQTEDTFHSSCDLTHHIVPELKKIGWDRLEFIDSKFENITLQVKDSFNRKHLLKLHYNAQNINEGPKCTTDLPQKFIFQWNIKGGLCQLLREYETVLCQYEEFWNEMEKIDSNTWVVEPEHPNYSCLLRRIVLGTNASIHITVDPKQPKIFPECVFLGADNVINPLKEKLNENLYRWDLNRSLLSNLEMVLDTAFPSPSNSKKEDFSAECGICYSYRSEQSIPDIVCKDTRCAQPFHQSCLFEWFRSLPSSRQSFNTIYGECPFCSKSMTVKMLVNT